MAPIKNGSRKPPNQYNTPSGSVEVSDAEEAKSMIAMGRVGRNVPDYFSLFRDQVRPIDQLTQDIYHNMYKEHETVKAGVGFIALTASKMIGLFEHSVPEIQEDMRQQFKNMRGSFSKSIKALVRSGIIYGHGALEAWLKLDKKGSAYIYALPHINSRTITYQLDRDPLSETCGEIINVIQWAQTSSEKVIPASKVVRFTHDEEDGNPFGNSRFQSFYKQYVINESMMKAWALTLERVGTPLLWANTKNGDEKIVINGEEMTRNEYLINVLNDIQNITGFVVEGDDAINVIQSNRAIGTDFQQIEDHTNKMIFRGLNLPSMIWENSHTGSFALGKKQFEIHLDSMAELMGEIIPEIIKAAVMPVIIAKYGEQVDYGTFQINQYQVEDLESLAAVYFSMSQEKFISARTRKDFDKIRKVFNVDPVSDEEFNALIKQWDKEEKAAQKGGPAGPNANSAPEGKIPGPKSQRAPKTPGKKDGRPPATMGVRKPMTSRERELASL